MKNIVSTVLLLIFGLTINAQTILSLTDSISISNAKIWGGISYDGQNINITTMILDVASAGNHINLVKFDTSLNQINSPIQLTTNSDLYAGRGITDHKHIYLNNTIYITYSLQQDQELFLFRIDTAGNRIGGLDTVQIGSVNPTNDMIFCSDDNSNIYLLHFFPPNRHIINSYDVNLNNMWTDTTSVLLAHNNIGGVVYKDSIYYMFTGSTFGHNSDLILTQWKSDWQPLTNNSIQSLIPSTNGDGNFFGTGCVYDVASELWFVGFQHIEQSSAINDEHIDIAVFDKYFNLIERYHVTDSICFRPHFLILDGSLYMVYDKAGNGVYIHKYKIQHIPSGENEDIYIKDQIQVYPNPTNDKITIDINGYNGSVNVEVFDLQGKLLETTNTTTISLKKYSKGIYVFRVSYGDIVEELKVVRD